MDFLELFDDIFHQSFLYRAGWAVPGRIGEPKPDTAQPLGGCTGRRPDYTLEVLSPWRAKKSSSLQIK